MPLFIRASAAACTEPAFFSDWAAGANTRASRRICVKGQTNVVDQLLMSRGKADIRNHGRLVRRFDDRRPLSKVE